MKIADNSLLAVRQYFRKQLSDKYGDREAGRFFELTVEHYFGLSAHDLLLNADKRLTESQLLKIMTVVKGLKRDVPIQYLLGRAWFYGLEIEVNNTVLIPRPETEELVDWTLNTVTGDRKDLRILDVGTGSGCIALALKSNLPVAAVTGIDVSKTALEVAKSNAGRLDISVDLKLANVLDETFDAGGQYDVIISNPPYVRQSEKEFMQPNVLDHEPHLALFVADEDALVFHRRIAEVALKVLNKGGWLFYEINEALGEPLKKMLEEKGFQSVELKKDLSGKYRMVRCHI